MKKLITFCLLLVFSLCYTTGLATHVAGGQVTYEHISGKKYGVTLKVYRDCSGISLNGGATLNVKCTSGGAINVTMSLISIASVSYNSGCTPQNTGFTGKGIEEHVFYGIIDFDISPFSALASCSGKIIFSYSIFARNGAITTGPNGTLYVEAILDLSAVQVNSSPAFDFEPINSLCCNNPAGLSWSCSDADGDSLSYEWTNPLRAYNTSLGFSGSFSYSYPISSYYPSGVTYPSTDHEAYPPVGLYLNPNSGEVIFTPVNCTEVTVMTIRVKEWRENGSGVMINHGQVMRDIQVRSSSCSANEMPKTTSSLEQTFYFNSCINNIEVTIGTTDSVLSGTAADSVTIDLKGSSIAGVITEIQDADSIYPKLLVRVTDGYLASKNYESHTLFIPFELRDDHSSPIGRVQKVLKINLVNNSSPSALITGVIIEDGNTNCDRNTGEDSLRFVREIAIQDSLNTYYIDTDELGSFNSCVLIDSLEVRVMPSPWFENDCGDTTFLAEQDSAYDITLYSNLKNGIAGYVMDNRDTGCVLSDSAITRAGQLLKLLPNGEITSTDDNGFYLFPLSSSGSHSIVLLSDSTTGFKNSCTDTLSVSYSGSGTKFADTLLTYKLKEINPRVVLSASRGDKIVRGGTSVLTANIYGAETLDSMNVFIKIPSNVVAYPSSSQSTVGWTSMGGGVYRSTVHNPQSRELVKLVIEAPAGNFSIWTRFYTETWIDSVSNDISLLDNKSTLGIIVVRPYDPNIKTTAQDSVFTTDDRTLEYTIMFQNTGNSPAVKVVVKDTLPFELELEDIEFVSSSHDYYPILNNKELWFVFENINLPDSGSNIEGSIGSVTFRIPINEDIYRDTFISNRAGIYFDFEDVVLTPTHINHFKTPIELEVDKSSYCPFDTLKVDFFTNFQPETINKFYLEITDSNGNYNTFSRVDSMSNSDTFGRFSFILDTSWLPSTDYSIRVSSSDFNTVSFEQYYKKITILEHPFVKLELSQDSICYGESIQVTSSWVGASNTWFLNSDSVANGFNLQADSFQHNDEVYLEAMSTDGCIFISDTRTLFVRNNIGVSFVGDSFSCAPQNSLSFFGRTSITGTGLGKLDHLAYQFGDGTNTTLSDTTLVSHSYSPQADYILQIIAVTNEGCSDTISQELIAGINPSSSFKVEEDSICVGDELLAIDTFNVVYGSKVAQIFYLDNNAIGSTGDTLLSVMTNSGNYDIKLIVRDNYGCVDSTIIPILVSTTPEASFSINDSTLCLNQLPFVATSTSTDALMTNWKFKSLNYNTSQIELNAPLGSNKLVLINQNGKCFDSTSVLVTVYDTSDASFDVNAEICQNKKLNLLANDIKTSTDYLWKVNGTDHSGSSIETNLSILGPVTIDLFSITTNGCKDSLRKTINVLRTGDTGMIINNICESEVFNVTNTSLTQNATFSYRFGDSNELLNVGFSENINNIYTNPGQYNVTQISSIGSCGDSIILPLSVFPRPVAQFSISSSGNTAELQNESLDGIGYLWNFGDGNTSNTTNLILDHTYTASGDYAIQLIVNSLEGCKDTVASTFSANGEFTFFIPNAYTPNDNGINDEYNIEPRELISALEMKVFNRWGQLVAHSSKKENILPALDPGIYIYIISISDLSGIRHHFKGTLSVLDK
jgi:uncharacterized repeat protein (TIGR01451 family)